MEAVRSRRLVFAAFTLLGVICLKESPWTCHDLFSICIFLWTNTFVDVSLSYKELAEAALPGQIVG